VSSWQAEDFISITSARRIIPMCPAVTLHHPKVHSVLRRAPSCQNYFLLGINRMLIDADYRAWVARQVKEPFVGRF